MGEWKRVGGSGLLSDGWDGLWHDDDHSCSADRWQQHIFFIF